MNFIADAPSAIGRSSLLADAPSTTKMSKKRIVHILKHCGRGNGNVHVAVDLACMQAEAGHSVAFASAGGTFETLLADFRVQHITINQSLSKPFGTLHSFHNFISLLRKLSPDVLHAHMMGAAILGYAASKLLSVPMVTTVHNSFDRHAFLMLLGKRVVAVSEAERSAFIGKGWNPHRLDVVMNAPAHSPRESFLSDKGGFTLHHPSIVAVCGLHGRKGVADIIDACAEAFVAFPEWHLALAGEGPDRQMLEDRAAKLGIRDRVDFLGYVQSPREVLLQADIFVLASYMDPCSLVIGEACAAGCPIIATAVGGTPEMLEYGRSGRLVTPGQPRELAVQLEQLMSSKSDRDNLRLMSRARAEVFNVKRLVADYDRVYESAAK